MGQHQDASSSTYPPTSLSTNVAIRFSIHHAVMLPSGLDKTIEGNILNTQEFTKVKLTFMNQSQILTDQKAPGWFQ